MTSLEGVVVVPQELSRDAAASSPAGEEYRRNMSRYHRKAVSIVGRAGSDQAAATVDLERDRCTQIGTSAYRADSVLSPPDARFPFAIVWTPIHPISWILPFVGHMGIADSNGVPR